MSDVPQGQGWWRASNGLYYPPEARPGSRQQGPGGQDGDQPPDDTPAGPAPDSGPTPETEPAPEPVPDGWDDGGGFDGPDAGGDHTVEGGRPRRRRWIIVVVLVLVVLAVAAGAGVLWLLTDDTDDADETDDADVTTTADPEATVTTDDDTETTTTTEEGPEEVGVFELAVGDCFDLAQVDSDDGLQITTVTLVDCDEPHRAQVFAIEQLEAAAGEPFPGTEARDETAQELCTTGFEDYVGVSVAESELVMMWLAPTEESWEEDDREVLCAVAASDDEQLTESVEGSGR